MTTEPMLFDGPTLTSGNWPFSNLLPGAYGMIMADPPWLFKLYSEKGEEKSAQSQYRCMEIEAIRKLPVAELAARDCVLWLWATGPLLPDAMETLKAWGFEYKTFGAWDKGRWGTGYLLRSKCEPFLIATKGSPKTDGRKVPNLLDEKRRQHSQKPEQAYRLAERLVPGVARLELFSRTDRPGWDAWGDEAGSLNEATCEAVP